MSRRDSASGLDLRAEPRGQVELILGRRHFERVVENGILQAQTSLDILTADFKSMLMPVRRGGYRSIVRVFRELTEAGVEIRLLHAGIPSGPVLRELRGGLPEGLTMRRCPRVHAKAVVVDCRSMYLGSANLTGAGLGAKADGRRNFEIGVWTHEPALIDGVLEHFNTLWEGHACAHCRRRDVCPVALEEPRLEARRTCRPDGRQARK